MELLSPKLINCVCVVSVIISCLNCLACVEMVERYGGLTGETFQNFRRVEEKRGDVAGSVATTVQSLSIPRKRPSD